MTIVNSKIILGIRISKVQILLFQMSLNTNLHVKVLQYATYYVYKKVKCTNNSCISKIRIVYDKNYCSKRNLLLNQNIEF